MKRKFAVLTILGALAALALPASSMALVLGPPGQVFEIKGTGMPQISGSLPGTCTLTKISGSIPASPGNEGSAVAFPISSPTATCETGTSITMGGGWVMAFNPQYRVGLGIPNGGFTLRYTSLPGCKLEALVSTGGGLWMNGTPNPEFTRSGWYANATLKGIWKNDGATCGLAPQTETMTFRSPSTSGYPLGAQVNLPFVQAPFNMYKAGF